METKILVMKVLGVGFIHICVNRISTRAIEEKLGEETKEIVVHTSRGLYEEGLAHTVD